MTKKRRCEICGKEFDGYRTMKYCSDKCRKEAKSKKQRAEYKSVEREMAEAETEQGTRIVVCAQCGTKFIYSDAHRKYCSDECRNEARRIAHMKTPPKTPTRNGLTATEICRLAESERLSYGEYVAKYNIP